MSLQSGLYSYCLVLFSFLFFFILSSFSFFLILEKLLTLLISATGFSVWREYGICSNGHGSSTCCFACTLGIVPDYGLALSGIWFILCIITDSGFIGAWCSSYGSFVAFMFLPANFRPPPPPLAKVGMIALSLKIAV